MIDGMRELEIELSRRLREIEGITKEAIKDCTLDLLNKSVNLAPVETGDLRGSAKATFSTDGLVGEVSFSTPYAHRQHEELTWRHPQGGQAKYLQQPYEENMDKYVRHIAENVRSET